MRMYLDNAFKIIALKNIIVVTAVLLTTISLMMMFPPDVHAERITAGKIIYAHGKVLAADANQAGRVLKKGDRVYSGETIVTGARSMAQVRMADKGYISIRANSQFRIDEFNLGTNSEEDAGFFSLLKGGFRAITGIIGKRKRNSYRVKTAVATIGIRGTDYTARICNDDCGAPVSPTGERGPEVDNGLYVGVLYGGIVVGNKLGQLDLDRLQYGFVKDAASAPRALLDAPKFLFFKSPSPRLKQDDDDQTTPQNEAGLDSRGNIDPPSDDALSAERQHTDIGEINGDISQNDIDTQTSFDKSTSTGDSLNDPAEQAYQPVAYADRASNGIGDNTASTLTTDANGFVEGFTAIDSQGTVNTYAIGTAQNRDLGLDKNTGIRWGRWSEGSAVINGQNLDLNNSSVHWVAGPSNLQNIALPQTGTASYNLVGNTTPTDNLGNKGILGNATLDANFNTMTVDSSVNVGINNQVWSGNSSAMPINASGQYSGAMNVNVSTGQTGSGRTNGFFTNNAAGSGMTYSMDANINGTQTNVSGAAVFEQK